MAFYGLETRRTLPGKSRQKPVVHLFDTKAHRDAWLEKSPINRSSYELVREACSKDEATTYGYDDNGRFFGVKHSWS